MNFVINGSAILKLKFECKWLKLNVLLLFFSGFVGSYYTWWFCYSSWVHQICQALLISIQCYKNIQSNWYQNDGQNHPANEQGDFWFRVISHAQTLQTFEDHFSSSFSFQILNVNWLYNLILLVISDNSLQFLSGKNKRFSSYLTYLKSTCFSNFGICQFKNRNLLNWLIEVTQKQPSAMH
jgi:hypothetical protein